ncbi:hypothetical protein [Actinoplanes sp. NPDC049316]|uniref:hypothetical protein n=1 Tax=Actinoplanes sp. NPDC049316 TaxID=3154727 RepID=UPI0034346F44
MSLLRSPALGRWAEEGVQVIVDHPLTTTEPGLGGREEQCGDLVERAISHLVNWKILDLGYRGRISDFPDLLRTVTNLEIYRARRVIALSRYCWSRL